MYAEGRRGRVHYGRCRSHRGNGEGGKGSHPLRGKTNDPREVPCFCKKWVEKVVQGPRKGGRGKRYMRRGRIT